MALFKPFRGSRASLDVQPLHDGYAYFCTDDGSFHIDYVDSDGNLQRKQINAKDAETLCGMSLDEIKEYVAAQSDWNQSDDTATDYIKNRTHWEETKINEIVLIDNVTLDNFEDSDSGFYRQYTDDYIDFENTIGQTYFVIWDGIEYECVCGGIVEDFGIGNANVMGNYGSKTTEPFALHHSSSADAISVSIKENGRHTLSVLQRSTYTEVHHIDPKYIKDMYGENIIEEVLIDNLTSEAYNDENYPQCTFVVGDTYNVIWNDTLYENVVCTEADGWRFLGGTEDYPFYIDDDGGNALYIEAEGEAFTVSVIHIVRTINKIDHKYIPDNVATKEYVDANDVQHINTDGGMTLDDIRLLEDGLYIFDEAFVFTPYGASSEMKVQGLVRSVKSENHYLYCYDQGVRLSTYYGTYYAESFTKIVGVDDATSSGLVRYRASKENDTVPVSTRDGYLYVDAVSTSAQILTDEQKIQARINIGALGEQIQADWNNNDATSASYIKNRPFYAEREVVFENINITGNLLTPYVFDSALSLEDGVMYYASGVYSSSITNTTGDVSFNGTYQCVDGIITIFPYENSGEPVLSVSSDKIQIGVGNKQGDASVMFDSLEKVVGYHTLDEKYIPDTIARVEDIPEISEQAQSDWSVNDDTSPVYVKNRPFYETDPFEVNVVDETTLSRNDFYEAGYNECALSSDILLNSGLVDGQEYTVTINGVNYVAIAKVLSGTVYLGNFNIINSELENSGETYYIDDYCFSIYNDDNVLDSYVVKITAIETQCIQIDEKFLNNKPGKFMPKGKTVSVFSKMAQSSKDVVVGENAEIFNSKSNIAAGSYSHAEGNETVATGYGSHSEGGYTEATNVYAHTEGNSSIASGASSHAENSSIASGNYSHSEGESTIAASDYQHVQGKYNVEDTDDKYAHIVGNGDNSARSNAHTLDWSGTAWFAGDVKVGGTGQDDTGAKVLATQDYVQSFLPKSTTVTIPAANWVGDSNPWSQVVTVNGATANSKLDLQPTALQIVALQRDEIVLMLQNDSGVVTAWAVGNKPTEDYTMQVLITEVVHV